MKLAVRWFIIRPIEMVIRLICSSLVLWLLAMTPTLVLAGSACEPQQQTRPAFEQAYRLAQQLQQQLDPRRSQVAIIARVGADLSRYGLKYSHAGFVVWEAQQQRWAVIHQLNHCGSNRSGLYREGLVNFFSDSPDDYSVLIVTLNRSLQQRLAAVLHDQRAKRLHHPHYSMIAYPYAVRYQNSNQWLLELLALSGAGLPISDRRTAQAQLQRSGYRYDRITLGVLQRLGASLFRANIAFDDHPPDADRHRQYAVVTVRSIVDYLAANRWLVATEELSL